MMACNAECENLSGKSADGRFGEAGTECGVVHSLAGCVRVCILFPSCIRRLRPNFTEVALKIVGKLAEVMASSK